MPENPHYIERLTDKRLDIDVLRAFLLSLGLQDERLAPHVSMIATLAISRIQRSPPIARRFPVYVTVWNHKDLIPQGEVNNWGLPIKRDPHVSVFSYFNEHYPEINTKGKPGPIYEKLWLVSDEVEELSGLESAIQPTRDAWVAVIKSNIYGDFRWSA